MSVKLEQFLLFSLVSVGSTLCKECYWNRKCSYDLFSTATPYDSIRGDLRDLSKDNNCAVISVWSLHRHGNRNPGSDVTNDIKNLQYKIKDQLGVEDTALQRSTKCTQDMDDLIHWVWNTTLEESASYLTGTGYEELYGLGRRINNEYLDFLKSVDKVYFRATDEQRTITSLTAFVDGMTRGGTLDNFSEGISPPLDRDDIIRPYENCQRYQDDVKNGQKVVDELAAYDSSDEFLNIRVRVQAKLFVDYKMSPADVFTMYELCRFDRSWNVKLRSPWCAFFSDEDLLVLEYRDDVRHYYRNGYGSWINAKLGAMALKDLYENFVDAAEGTKRSLVSYFTHDTMMEMVYCALGLYADPEPLRGSARNANRLWRSSKFTAFASNFIAVLSRCDKSGQQTHRVQILINEKPTALCPEEGCTWQQFVEKFRVFSEANLDFCTASGTEAHMSGRSDIKINMASSIAILTTLLGIIL